MTPKGLNIDPELRDMPVDTAEAIRFFNPRPVEGGAAHRQVEQVDLTLHVF